MYFSFHFYFILIKKKGILNTYVLFAITGFGFDALWFTIPLWQKEMPLNSKRIKCIVLRNNIVQIIGDPCAQAWHQVRQVEPYKLSQCKTKEETKNTQHHRI